MIDVDTTHIVTKTKKGSWSDNPFGFSDYNCATNTLFFVAVSYEKMRYCWTESGLIGPDKTRLVKEMLNLSPKIESSVKLWDRRNLKKKKNVLIAKDQEKPITSVRANFARKSRKNATGAKARRWSSNLLKKGQPNSMAVFLMPTYSLWR